MKTTKTNCRSQVGITVGLIDSLISISRVLASRLRDRDIPQHNPYIGAIYEALADFSTDKDVMYVAGIYEASKIAPLTEQDMENREFVRKAIEGIKASGEKIEI